jgi:hypothetical protein
MSNATIEAPVPTVESPAKFAVRDIFGRPIFEGDTIVYATRRGSDTFLNKLVVTFVGVNAIKGWTPEDVNRRTRTLTNFKTVAKVA